MLHRVRSMYANDPNISEPGETMYDLVWFNSRTCRVHSDLLNQIEAGLRSRCSEGQQLVLRKRYLVEGIDLLKLACV